MSKVYEICVERTNEGFSKKMFHGHTARQQKESGAYSPSHTPTKVVGGATTLGRRQLLRSALMRIPGLRMGLGARPKLILRACMLETGQLAQNADHLAVRT